MRQSVVCVGLFVAVLFSLLASSFGQVSAALAASV